MTFKDIKQGYPVYVLHKGQMTARTGKVTMVSQPRFPQVAQQPMASGLVMDVTIEEDGQSRTYTMPESSAVVCAGDVIISTDRGGILMEVEAMRNASEEVVNSVQRHREIMEKCDRILTEWNPALAEKKQQEERISSLEDEVRGLGTMLKDFITEFKK